MLSTQANSFRRQSRLAISLSWVGGYVNLIVWTICGTAVSHMSGNVTQFGQSLFNAADGRAFSNGIFLAFILGCFLFGAFASGVMTDLGRRRGSRSTFILPIAIETILLLALAMLIEWQARGHAGGLLTSEMVGLGAAAMGLQNATITKISGAVVRTTHVTGVVTDLGLESAHLLAWLSAVIKRPRRSGGRSTLHRLRRRTALRRLVLLASILGSFLFGAFAGSAMFAWLPRVATFVPAVFLVGVVLTSDRRVAET